MATTIDTFLIATPAFYALLFCVGAVCYALGRLKK